MAVNPEKEKAIELAMSAVERQFGKGSIMRLGKDEPLVRDIQVISTGSISLDIALGVGGVPRGRIVEIYGPESSGKTTLCLHVVAEAQKKGGVCGYIDAEHAMDVGLRTQARACAQMTCSCPNRTRESKGWRSPRCSSVPAPLTSSSLIPWRRWFPKPSSKARWGTRTWKMQARLTSCFAS